MIVQTLTGVYTVVAEGDTPKASIHAGSTGLSGLTGYAGAHVCECMKLNVQPRDLNKSLVCVKKRLITLLTLFKASIHAGFNVTGLHRKTDMTCNEA